MQSTTPPPDWDAAYDQLQGIEAAGELTQADRDVIDRIDKAFSQLDTSSDLTDTCLQAAVLLAALRQEKQLGDPCTLLLRVLEAVPARQRATPLVESLATALLDADLPWEAATALAYAVGPLSEQGSLTRAKIERVRHIIREDAMTAAPELQSRQEPF